jgi:TRAP-type C4-dicarboxylate transport system permease small subunit
MTAETPSRAGKIRYAAAAWLLGLPLPVIIIALLWGGCTRM